MPSVKPLFSEYFLEVRLPSEYPAWNEDRGCEAARQELLELYDGVKDTLFNANEGQTEDEFVRVVFRILGWHMTVQAKNKVGGQSEWPDYALFVSTGEKKQADKHRADELDKFWGLASVVAEAKAWGTALSSQSGSKEDPSFQMVRYLYDIPTVRWGILTNGKFWRLYNGGVPSAATQYYEIDLESVLVSEVAFKRFWFFFRRDAFVLDHSGMVFPQRVLEGSVTYARAVGDELKELVFKDVFPLLAGGFVRSAFREGQDVVSELGCKQAYSATLSLLYKILFLLYAEARSLLPVGSTGYRKISLSQIVGEVEKANKVDFGSESTMLYGRLKNLFDVVSAGDGGLGVPQYNGGLFRRSAPFNIVVYALSISDDRLSEAISMLSHWEGERIDYGYLDVRELGAIYEGLLEYQLIVDNAVEGKVHLEDNRSERRESGAFYTPSHIVQFIVKEALSPILNEREFQYNVAMDEWEVGKPGAETAVVSSLLGIKVCDPAMGSGHFLVETVDFLTDGMIRVIDRRRSKGSNFEGRVDPISSFLHTIREAVKSNVEGQHLSASMPDLTDTQLLMRVVMKRCIYGVDLNPLAVELAKLSLWLHTFTVGAPLSFLDHHLRSGNSLFGVRMRDVLGVLKGQITGQSFSETLEATLLMNEVSAMTDATVEEVRKSEALFLERESKLQGKRGVLSVWASQWWGNKLAYDAILSYEDQVEKLAGEGREVLEQQLETISVDNVHDRRLRETILTGIDIAVDNSLFHWDIEFSDVFIDQERKEWLTNPGFDAVIGNPPYDELSEKVLGRLIKERWFIGQHYKMAGKNRINLYRLFIVLAQNIVKEGGVNSFIVPMSLLGDKFSESVRRMMFKQGRFRRIEVFPQKDDPNRRVFRGAKLPTCLYVYQFGNEWHEQSIVSDVSKDSFVVRVHSGGVIEDSPPVVVNLTLEELRKFDARNLAIPLVSQSEWALAQRLATALYLEKLGDVAKPLSGEITFNKKTSEFRSDNVNHELLLRGGHVQRYALVKDTKQGVPEYLDSASYLKTVARINSKTKELTKAFHHEIDRVVFQESSALDNWRRIIATYLEAGHFCGHKVGYFVNAKWNLWVLLAIFNSKVVEWRFRAVSVTNSLSAYQLSPIPVPRFTVVTATTTKSILVKQVQGCIEKQRFDECLAILMDCIQLGQLDVVEECLAFLARTMVDLNKQKMVQEGSFLNWLGIFTGFPISEWIGVKSVRNFGIAGWPKFRKILDKNANRFAVDADKKIDVFHDRYKESALVVNELGNQIEHVDFLIDSIVFSLYGLSNDEIEVIENRLNSGH